MLLCLYQLSLQVCCASSAFGLFSWCMPSGCQAARLYYTRLALPCLISAAVPLLLAAAGSPSPTAACAEAGRGAGTGRPAHSRPPTPSPHTCAAHSSAPLRRWGPAGEAQHEWVGQYLFSGWGGRERVQWVGWASECSVGGWTQAAPGRPCGSGGSRTLWRGPMSSRPAGGAQPSAEHAPAALDPVPYHLLLTPASPRTCERQHARGPCCPAPPDRKSVV